MKCNVETVSITKAKDTIRVLIPLNLPAMLHGAPGVGKTDMVNQLGQELGRRVIRLELPNMTFSGVHGFQFIDRETQKTIDYLPHWLPDPDEPVIIFFDEISAARPETQMAAYQYLHGRYRLSKNAYVMGAGNGSEDGAASFSTNTALASRLCHMRIQVNPVEWLTWALDNKVHRSVMTAIRIYPDMLEQVEQWLEQGTLIGATPRGWFNVSQALLGVGSDARDKTEIIVSGLVGKQASERFYNVVEELDGMVEVADFVKADPDRRARILQPKLAHQYAMVYGLVGYANDEHAVIQHLDAFNSYAMALVKQNVKIAGGIQASPGDLASLLVELLVYKAGKLGCLTALQESAAFADYRSTFGTFLSKGAPLEKRAKKKAA